MASKLLRDLAQNARNRLMNRKDGSLKKKAVYSPNVKLKIISNEDKEFNERAMSLGEEDMITPLKKLINNDYYKTLSRDAKERYLLQTIDKYTKFREKIEFEQSQKAL